MDVTIKMPELNLNTPHKLNVVYATVKKSKNDKDMLYLLLKEPELNVSVSAYILFDMFDRVRNFANAFGIKISDGILRFNTDELIGRSVYAQLDVLGDGSFVVKRFVSSDTTGGIQSVNVADLGDPFEDVDLENAKEAVIEVSNEDDVKKDPFGS